MNDWYEVWADETHDIPYLLLLRPEGDTCSVCDPKENNRQVFKASTYEECKLWLLEDEFVCVRGRMELDD